ncbi:MAG: trypsin-like serine protease [Dysgonamonadaceae bacterium]|jgi:hypothetical protein|nr:trypsin-like serine protease [Dysgonamonadaceae bacterium]
MKNRIGVILLFYVIINNVAFSQISQGGIPLFLDHHTLRSSKDVGFIEMPAFDLDSVLRLDEINEQNMRGSYSFAHKFYTDIEKGREGTETVLSDGTKVWQVGIYSRGAYSINLLFTQFDLPKGGQLFIYNENRSHVIGAFDYRNNSPEKILPIRPVAGEAIIVEYSEPADAEFEGKLKIGEVNHDYRNILRREPGDSETSYAKNFLCMPDVLCSDADETLVRATVLLVINGSHTCTGTLINNTENDETPYLLTAVHCLNDSLASGIYRGMDYYVTKAGTVIAFFNYNRPVCGSNMKATEEMSIAIAQPKVIIEKKDIALLEFREKPPVYYNAYYAGWSIDTTKYMYPYTNIHHPAASTKRYSLFAKKLALVNYFTKIFDSRGHWEISSWNIGSTYPGSSGSPLFDKNNFLVGSLSGGNSTCKNSNPGGESDYYAAFFKGWENENEANQLKTYLDPNNKGIKQLDGFDPYSKKPFVRVSNADYNKTDGLVTTQYTAPNEGFLFGNSNLNVIEFAEEFNLKSESALYGVYFFMPAMPFAYTTNVKIEVYTGEQSPEQLIAEKTFLPQYLASSDFTYKNITTEHFPSEHFVAFDNPVKVNKKLFIAYKINYSTGKRFVIYNTNLSVGKLNTAWIKNEQGVWTQANNYATQPISTSLAIQPLLRYNNETSVPITDKSERGNKLQYLRKENKLILSEELSDAGSLHIFSVSGQIIQKITLEKEQNSVVLKPQNSGTIGIVRISRGNEVYSGKIIY